MHNKRDLIKIIVIALVYVIFALGLWKLMQGYLTKEFFSGFIGRLGFLAPIAMFMAQLLQVVIAPIPVQPISIISGYIFGAFWGFLIAYLGLVAGSFLNFYIGKTFGRPLVEKIISKKIISQYDGYAQKASLFILSLIFWLPLFPDDEITYILGMSKAKAKRVAIPILIGKTGGASTAIIGAGLGKYSQYSFQIIFLVLLVTILMFYYRNFLEKIFNKLIKKIKRR